MLCLGQLAAGNTSLEPLSLFPLGAACRCVCRYLDFVWIKIDVSLPPLHTVRLLSQSGCLHTTVLISQHRRLSVTLLFSSSPVFTMELSDILYVVLRCDFVDEAIMS